jgi:hypothetical protein
MLRLVVMTSMLPSSQEGYAAGERVLTLPCAHLFHAACISPWLLQFSCICPICRASLSPTTGPPSTTAIATHQPSPAAAVAATIPRPSLAAVQCVAAVQCDAAAAAASMSNRMRLRGRCVLFLCLAPALAGGVGQFPAQGACSVRERVVCL